LIIIHNLYIECITDTAAAAMRRLRKPPYILVLVVICNFILCCNASARTTWCERIEDLDNTLCRFEDLSDSVLIDICERIDFHHKPNPTRDQIVRIARTFCFPFKEAQDNIHDEMLRLGMQTVLLNELIVAQAYVPSIKCNKAEDIKLPICTYEDLKDEVLIDICKKIGYQHKPNPTREQLVLTAPMCRVWTKSLDKSDDVAITKFLIADIVDEFFEGHEQLQLLYKSHIDMLKDASYIAMSRNDRVNYILSKHNVNGEEKSMRTLLREKLEEEDLHLTLGIDTKVKEQWIERYVPSRREIAKLPDWYSYKPVIKGEAIKIKIFRKDGDAVTSQWSKESQTWSNPRPITLLSESNYNNKLFVDLMRKSMQYEHVVLFQGNSDGGEYGRLLTKQTLVIGFNHGDDQLDTAIRVLDEYKLRDDNLSKRELIMEYERNNELSKEELMIWYTSGDDERKSDIHLMSVTEFLRKYVSDIPKQRVDEKFRVTFVLVCILLSMYVVYSLLVPKRKKRKKAMKLNPKKISLLCRHQPVMKKTIYVKSLATKRLNQGKRLNGIMTRSRAQDIQIERKTGQPTVMYKIKASNGEVYVPVHIKGSEEAVEKAVVLIQEAVGTENVDEEIELPPTNPKQSSTSPKPKSSKISSSAPLRIPKKKKSTSSSFTSTIWLSVCASCQSLMTMTVNTCKTATSSIRNLFNVALDWAFDDFMYWALATPALTVFIHFLPGIFDPKWKDYALGLGSYAFVYIVHHMLQPKLILVSVFILVVIPGCIISYHKMLLSCCYYVQQKAAQFARLYSEPNIIPNYTIFTSNTDQSKTEDAYWIILFLVFAMFGWICALSYEYASCLKTKKTIYVKSTKAKELKVQQQKKMQEIVNKSDLDQALIDSTAVVDNYVPIHMSGSKRSVWKAIELIKEAVGTEHVSTTLPSNTVSIQESSSKDNGSEARPKNQQEPSTAESSVQPETTNNDGNNLAKEASTTTKSPPTTLQVKEEEEEVPSEIGIDSCQGMTRETITEASISSLNDRSNTSKAYSNFTTLNENDPLLIFLRSQASCIKGSVDEFYTWLVKSEDIDSMLALKEAVNEDDYLNDMKVGDGGGSGIKGFKRKAFLRAISEYFNDDSDTKSTAEEHQSLPQCQKKNLSETLDPPEELVCPISLNLMTEDPVVASDGITYERASIEDWFEKSKAKISEAEKNLKHNPHSEVDQRIVENGICSPVYGSKLENSALVPNTVVRNMARSFKVTTK